MVNEGMKTGTNERYFPGSHAINFQTKNMTSEYEEYEEYGEYEKFIPKDFAAQQLVDISFSPGDVLWQHSLQRGRNATMEHEIIPNPVNRLTRTEDIPINEHVNMQNIHNM
jgi:hypothetical protein